MYLYDKLRLMNRARRIRRQGEPECIEFLLSRDLRGKLCLDIGAHKGAFTYWMCQAVGKPGQVIGFEPQQELYSYLQSVRRCFGVPQLRFESTALSNESGERTLVRPIDGWGGAGFHDLNTQNSEKFTVQAETLDRYAAERKLAPVAFIKCDVEGHEEQVFRGGERLLTRDRPVLLFECHHRVAAQGSIFRYLDQIGYVGHFFAARKLHAMRYWEELNGRDNPDLTYYVFTSLSDAPTVPVATAAERAEIARRPRTWEVAKAA